MSDDGTRSAIFGAIAGLAQIAKEHGLEDLNAFLVITAALVKAGQERGALQLFSRDMGRSLGSEGGASCE